MLSGKRKKAQQQELIFSNCAPVLSPVLKDFIKAPIFAARSQPGTREILVDGNLWSIGVEHPIERWSNRSLSIQHGRICFALLEFWRRQGCARSLRFSLGDLCRVYSGGLGKGGRYYRDLLELLFDLRDTWVKIAHPDGTAERFTIIGDIKVIESPNGAVRLDRVDLSPEFFNLLSAIESMAYIRLDVLNTIPSTIAASIYTFLPSRAYHHTQANPFQINLNTLIGQIGLPVPTCRSQRHKIFTQNANTKSGSIIQQLDGAILTNGILRVKLAETVDRKDYKVLAWVEPNENPSALPRGKLFDAWCEGGGTEESYQTRLAQPQPLNDYEYELLQRSGVASEPLKRFLEKTKTLLGPTRFQEVLAELKSDALEGKKPKKTPQAKLIHRLIGAIMGR